MVCGYFGAVKVGDLYRLEGILNKAVTQKQSFGILLIMEWLAQYTQSQI